MGEAQKVTPAALGGFIFGLGSTVASMALPQAYPGFPVWGWQMLFWGGGASMAMSASVVAYEMILRPKLQGKGNLVALGLTIFFALGFLASGAWYIYGRRADNIAAPARQQPQHHRAPASPSRQL